MSARMYVTGRGRGVFGVCGGGAGGQADPEAMAKQRFCPQNGCRAGWNAGGVGTHNPGPAGGDVVGREVAQVTLVAAIDA